MEEKLSAVNFHVSSFDVTGILQESRENVAKNKKSAIINSSLKRCLFINTNQVSKKLLDGKILRKDFRIFNFDPHFPHKSVRDYVEKFRIQVIILDASQVGFLSKEMANDIVEARLKGIDVYEAHDFYELVNKRIPLVRLQTDEYVANNVFSVGMHKFSDLYAKRCVDLLISTAFLPVVLPIITAAVLLTLISSKSNPFFIQERVGHNSKRFKIFKIRTMTSSGKGVTRIGKILRRTKIDELPQILNIIKGEMSFIGPRPEQPEFVAMANEENAYFDLRHLIKPGLTGWAQVNLPKATPKDNLDKLEYDLYYIKNYNVLFDLEIILKTIRVVVTLNSN